MEIIGVNESLIVRWALILQGMALLGFSFSFLWQRVKILSWDKTFYSMGRVLFGLAWILAIFYMGIEHIERMEKDLPLSWRAVMTQAIYIIGGIGVVLYYVVEREELREVQSRPARRWYEDSGDYTDIRERGSR